MKDKLLRLHFLLYPLFAILFFYAQNLRLYSLSSIITPLLLSLGIGLLAFGFFYLFFRQVNKSTLAASLTGILFFSYGHLYNLGVANLGNTIQIKSALLLLGVLGPFFILLAFAVWLRFQKESSLQSWHAPLTATFLILSCFQIIQIVQLQFQKQSSPSTSASTYSDEQGATTTPVISAISTKNLPNIYFLIFDAYARADILQEYYEVDNSDFLKQLQDRGFFVGTESNSNYFTSIQSISSTLNMTYLDHLTEKNSETFFLGPLTQMINQNAVHQFLKPYGYQFVGTEIGFEPLEPRQADVYFQPQLQVAPIVRAFFETTLLRLTYSYHDDYREKLLNTLDMIPVLGVQHAPCLLYSHITLPHPPFVFNESGQPTGDHHPLNYNDGQDFFRDGRTIEDYTKGYRAQIPFTNQQILKTIDTILESDISDPIIIVMSDHGVRRDYNNQSIEKTNLKSCSAILFSCRLPDQNYQSFYPSITPVNLFRKVLNTQFDQDYPILPDKIFYTNVYTPYQFQDVTERVRPNTPQAPRENVTPQRTP